MENYTAVNTDALKLHATAWINLTNMCWVRKVRHKEHSQGYSLYTKIKKRLNYMV